MVQQTGLLGNFGQNMQRGFGRIGDAITGKDPNARDQLAIALMSLSGNPQQTQALQQLAANRIQQRKQNEANNKTVAFIKNINPEIGALVEANPALAPTALQQIMRARMSGGADNSTALMKNFAFLREQFPDMQPNDLLQMARGGTSVNITNQMGSKQYGNPPKDTAWARDENGNVKLDERGIPIALPIQGTVLFNQTQKVGDQKEKVSEETIVTSGVVIGNIDKIRKRMEDSWFTTGIFGQALRNVGGTAAFDIKALIAPIQASIGFDRLQRMRDASPTGGALGQVSERELDLLMSTLSSLDQAQTEDQFLQALNQVEQRYTKIIEKFNAYPEQAMKAAGYTPLKITNTQQNNSTVSNSNSSTTVSTPEGDYVVKEKQ